MKVKCVGCDSKFDFAPENFSDHEIVFCPTCGLDHEVLKNRKMIVAQSA